MDAVIKKETESGVRIIYTNRIIQIGYDFICSPDRKDLEADLEAEMAHQDISLDRKEEILTKIKLDFNIGD